MAGFGLSFFLGASVGIKKEAEKFLSVKFPNLKEQSEHENRYYALQSQVGVCHMFIEKVGWEADRYIQEIEQNMGPCKSDRNKMAAKILKKAIDLVDQFKDELFAELEVLINQDIVVAAKKTSTELLDADFSVLLITESKIGQFDSNVYKLANYVRENYDLIAPASKKLIKYMLPENLTNGAPFEALSFTELQIAMLIIARNDEKNAAADIELLGFRN